MLLLLLAPAGCSGTDDVQPGHTFELVEEDGVPTAVNSAVPRYGGELFVFEKVLEIRPGPANQESLLYQPSQLAMDADAIYVADTGNHRIAVFDREGDFVRGIGRPGEGPGELRAPGAGVAESFFLRDGLLWVWVGGRNATARFRTDGTLLDELSAAEFSRRGVVQARTEDGALAVWELLNERDTEYQRTSARIRVFDADGEVLASIGTPPVPTRAIVTTPDGWSPTLLNYASFPQVRLLPDRRVLVSSGLEPTLRWFELSGDLARQVMLDIPMDVTAEDRAAVEAALDQAIAAAEEAGDERRAGSWRRTRDTLTFAEHKAPWSMVEVDDSGHLWLLKPFASAMVVAEGRHEFEARVVSPEGEYLGDTRLPLTGSTSLLSLEIVDGHLLAIVDDPETGEAVPTVYRIRPTLPGFRYP